MIMFLTLLKIYIEWVRYQLLLKLNILFISENLFTKSYPVDFSFLNVESDEIVGAHDDPLFNLVHFNQWRRVVQLDNLGELRQRFFFPRWH